MGVLHHPLQFVQVGKQSVVGTAVPATWQMRIPFEFSDAGTAETPTQMAGEMMANAGGVREAVERAVAISVPATPVTFEDLLPLLNMGIETSPGASETDPTFLWANAFIRSRTGVPAQVGCTIEHHNTDGTTAHANDYRDAFFTQWTLSGGRGQLLQFSATGMANVRATGTVTDLSANFPLSDTVYCPFQKFGIYVDDTYAAAASGGTLFSDDVLSFTLTFDSGFTELRPADASTDLGYSMIETDGSLPKATLEMVCLAKPGASELLEQERDKAESQSIRGIRLEADGATPIGGAVARKISVTMAAKHVPDTYVASAVENGHKVVTLQMETHPDPASVNWFQVAIRTTQEDMDPAT